LARGWPLAAGTFLLTAGFATGLEAPFAEAPFESVATFEVVLAIGLVLPEAGFATAAPRRFAPPDDETAVFLVFETLADETLARRDAAGFDFTADFCDLELGFDLDFELDFELDLDLDLDAALAMASKRH